MSKSASVFRVRGGTALVGLGALATLGGLWAALGQAKYLISMWEGREQVRVGAEFVAESCGGAIATIAQTVACLLFTVMAAFVLSHRDSAFAVWMARACATVNILWLLASVGTTWPPSKYMFAGANGFVFLVLCLALAAAWLVAASTPAPVATQATPSRDPTAT